jgi:DNA-binding NtrC family response regulator
VTRATCPPHAEKSDGTVLEEIFEVRRAADSGQGRSIGWGHKSILQDAGHDVVAFSTVGDALAIALSDEWFDLLFTDITLGEDIRGGLAARQEVAKLRPGLPVLHTSGQGITPETIALFVPSSWFLAKPYIPLTNST